MAARHRQIRKKASQKRALTVMERRTVGRLLSMQTTAAFRSQLEMEHRYGNLSAPLLSSLFSAVNQSSMGMNQKRAMLGAITYYNELV